MHDSNIKLVSERIIQKHFGSRRTIIEFEIVKTHVDYTVVILLLSNPAERMVLKLAGPNASLSCPFDQTFIVNKQVREQTSVPTFDALAVDTSYKCFPWRYLLMTYVEGIPWIKIKDNYPASDFQKVYRDLGKAVAQLHTISYQGFGEFSSDKEANTNYLSALVSRAKRRIKNRYHQNLFINLLEKNKELFTKCITPKLTHEDLNPGNIIVSKREGCWELAGIIDFDSAWAGECESDLVRLELWKGMSSPCFFEEYELIHSISTDYSKRKPFLQLLWCLEFALPSDEHHETTKKVCQRLGIPVITFS